MHSVSWSMAAVQPSIRRAVLPASQQKSSRRPPLRHQRICVVLATPESESKEETSATAGGPGVEVGEDGALYDDGLPDDPSKGMSDDMKKRLRKEYMEWGGSENTPIKGNPFLWAILFGFLFIMAGALVTGALD